MLGVIPPNADDLVRMHRRQQLRLRQWYPLRRNEIRNDGPDRIGIVRRHSQHHRDHVPPIHRLDEPVVYSLPQPEPAISHALRWILLEKWTCGTAALGCAARTNVAQTLARVERAFVRVPRGI